MAGFLRSDTGIYVAAGAFAILVYVVAVGVVVAFTPVDLERGELVTFTTGFLLFMSVYFVAMAIYRAIDSRDPEV